MTRISSKPSSGRPTLRTALLLIACIFCVATSAAADSSAMRGNPTLAALRRRSQEKAETALQAGKADYSSVREDFACRACVSLTSAFFKTVLEPARERYARLLEKRSGTLQPRKESMVAEVHDLIDGLCAAVKAKHAAMVDTESQGTAAANEKEEQGKSSEKTTAPSAQFDGSQASIREGIEIACAPTLEDLNDAFTETAFKLLMPNRFHNTDADADAEKEWTTATQERKYVLPKAGDFCEQHKLCSPYLHYHITSEESVAARRDAGRAKERKATAAAARKEQANRGGRGSDSRQANPGASGPYSNEERLRDEAAVREGRRRGQQKRAVDLKPDLVELLKHPHDLLATALHELRSSEVCTWAFWRRLIRSLRSRSLWFHLSPQWRFLAITGVSVLSVAFLVAAISIVCCCGSKPTNQRERRERQQMVTVPNPCGNPEMSATTPGKKQS